MGMFEVKDQVYGFMGISPAVGSDPRSEPVSMPDGKLHQINLTYGRRLLRLHQYPAYGGWGRRRPGPFLPSVVEASSHFGSATWIRQD